MAVIKAVTVTNPAIVFLMKFINGLGSFNESLPHALLINGDTILIVKIFATLYILRAAVQVMQLNGQSLIAYLSGAVERIALIIQTKQLSLYSVVDIALVR